MRPSRWRRVQPVGRRGLLAVLMVAAGLVVVLTARQLLDVSPRITGASGARASSFVAEIPQKGGEACQQAVAVPSGTDSLQLTIGTFDEPGPPLTLTLRASASRRTIANGSVRGGWIQGTLVVPLMFESPADRATEATLCVTSSGGARIAIAGEAGGAQVVLVDGEPGEGTLSVNSQAQDGASVADLLSIFADRIGRGNAAWIGPWTAWAIGLLLATGIGFGALAVARTDGFARPSTDRYRARRWTVIKGRTVPTAGLALAAAALTIGGAWALLIPPFQVPDETSHFAYVQYLSESGDLPVDDPTVPAYSDEQREVMGALGFARIIGRPLERVVSTSSGERNLRSVERAEYEPSAGNATTASANPPLYYALQAPVFLATSRGSVLTQLLVMRFVSVLLLAGTVLLAFMFVRELLPSSPWAWTAGGTACAFQPVLGFVGSGVNSDSLLFFSATLLFFALARVLRRGMTTRRVALAAGAVTAGLLTKPLFFALLPVAITGIALAALRHGKGWLRPCAIATAIVVIPVTLVSVVGSVAFNHPYFAVAASVAGGPGDAAVIDTSFSKRASFMLQLFLPRLPFLADQLPGVPPQDIWIAGTVGVFGWVDYGFGRDYTVLGTQVFIGLLFLMGTAMLRHRAALRAEWRIGLCCLIAIVAVPAAVAYIDYQAFVTLNARFEQARYLFPLIGLYAALFALAAKALGPHLGRLLLPALWGFLSLHTVAAAILTVNRYYL